MISSTGVASADSGPCGRTPLRSCAISVLATIRKSLTKLETAGHTASAFVLHPTDWEGVELALSSQVDVHESAIPSGSPELATRANTIDVQRAWGGRPKEWMGRNSKRRIQTTVR